MTELEPAPDFKYLIVFDFDDTLFPTSYLESLTDSAEPHILEHVYSQEVYEELDILEQEVRAVFDKARRFGSVYIVTNSMEGWVKSCVERFFPRSVETFKKIPIISAHKLYHQNNRPSKVYDDYEGMNWKYLALSKLVELERINAVKIMGIGDSLPEILAVEKMSQMGIPGVTVKLQPQASPSGLVQMLRILRYSFRYLMNVSCSIDNEMDNYSSSLNK